MQTFAPRGKIHGPILPQFVLETSISFGAKIMYALLCNYASDNDHCWPSQATLAARLSCSVSGVKKYLAELVGIQLIQVRHEQYRSSVYYMVQPVTLKVRSNTNQEIRQTAAQETSSDCCQPEVVCPQSNSGYINTLNKQRERQNPPLPPVKPTLPEVSRMPQSSVLGCAPASDFEKIWELYPRKEAKGLARSFWLYLQRKGQLPSLARMEASIQHFMASENWQREHGRFVPQMSNWLRGQRWLDDSVTTAAQQLQAVRQDADALAARQREEEIRKAAQHVEHEALRPRFDAFVAKFHTRPGLTPMAFGLWLHLHEKHRSPSAEDVPADNQLGIVDFLYAFKRRCTEAAWRKAATQTTLATFTSAPNGTQICCEAPLRHHPVRSRLHMSQAFAKAV